MNANIHEPIKLRLQEREIPEVLYGLLQTLVFYRSAPKGAHAGCGGGGVVAHKDATERSPEVLLHYIEVESEILSTFLRNKISQFQRNIKRSRDGTGLLFVKFFERLGSWPAYRENPWEVWTFEVCLVRFPSKAEEDKHKMQLTETFGRIIAGFGIAVSNSYLPLAYSHDEIASLYFTRYKEFQPYRFRIEHHVEIRRTTALSDAFRWMMKNTW